MVSQELTNELGCEVPRVAGLPIETERAASRYAWIERFLSTETIDDMDVMATLTRGLLPTLSAQGQTLMISMDQISLDAGRALAMMSARVGERALPLFWQVKNTKGNIPIKCEVDLCNRGVITNIGYIHDKGHPEPWFLAMDTVPARATTLDYGLR